MWEPAAFIAAALLAAWWWAESLRARERAVEEARDACERHALQFLDESVECVSVRLARDEHGRAALRRIYRFEFSDDGHNRRIGRVTLAGPADASVYLEPYLIH